MPPAQSAKDGRTNSRPRKPRRQPQGGTHTIKAEHRTGTHWDNEAYKVLREACQIRKMYRKDMPKWMMIRDLAEDDKNNKNNKNKADQVLKKKKTDLAGKKKRTEREKKKRAEKHARRAKQKKTRAGAGDEVVVEESEEDDPYLNNFLGIEGHGQFLHDDEDDASTSSSSSEPITATTVSPAFPHQRLRLFEWPFDDLPSPHPPKYPYTPGGSRREDVHDEILPTRIPYVVTKLVTTVSKELLELPGRLYPHNIAADFVPKLQEDVAEAARNGTMIGSLRTATIESGKQWSKRTLVQEWNGCMYLSLPERMSLNAPETEEVDVQNGWPEKASSQGGRSKPKKQDLMLAFLENSESRPPICYLPSYLEYGPEAGESTKHHNLNNLFYVRFSGMDLPHYYFWTRRGQWRDPTTPNPEWHQVKEQDEEHEKNEIERKQTQIEEDARSLHLESNEPGKTSTLQLDNTRARIKKLETPEIFQSDTGPPVTSEYDAAVWLFEKDLYENGLAATLYRLRNEWIADEKEMQWESFTENLVDLYPSGLLPTAPPVHLAGPNIPKPQSLTEKFAAIEVPSPIRRVIRIKGDEPWTRDDDAYWDIVELNPDQISARETGQEVSSDDLGPLKSARPERSSEEFDSWLQDISPSYAPTSSLPSATPVDQAERALQRRRWENNFQKHAERYSNARDARRAGRKPSKNKAAAGQDMWKNAPVFDDDSEEPEDHPSAVSRKSSLKATRSKPKRLSKVTFSPTTVEKRVAYSDAPTAVGLGISDSGIEGDVSSVSTPNRRSSIRLRSRGGKPTLKVYTGSTRTARRRTTTGRRRRNSEVVDPTFTTPSTPSDHIKSPFLPRIWRYPPDHPNAAWKPRRESTASEDSLEYYLEKRKRVKEDGEGNKRKRKKQKTEDPIYVPSPTTLSPVIKLGRQTKTVADPTYRKSPSESSPGSSVVYRILKIPKRRPKPDDTPYTPGASSGYSLDSPPKAPRRERTRWVQDPTYESPPSPTPLAPNRKPTEKTNGYSRSIQSLEPSPTPSDGSSAWGWTTPPSTPANVRRFIDAYSSSPSGTTLPPFEDAPLTPRHALGASTSLVPPNAPRRKTTRRLPDPSYSPPPSPTPVYRKGPTSNKPISRTAPGRDVSSSTQNGTKVKRTILGFPYIEPLTLAPARRLSYFQRRPPEEPTSASSSHIRFDPSTLGSSSLSLSPDIILSDLSDTSYTSTSSSTGDQDPSPLNLQPKRPIYDIPATEYAPLVPPNTPAVSVTRRGGRAVPAQEIESELDVGVLKTKIGVVKTTRRGVSREISVGVDVRSGRRRRGNG